MKAVFKFASKAWGLRELAISIVSIFGLIGGLSHRQRPDLAFLSPPQDEITANFDNLDYRRFVVQLLTIQIANTAGETQSVIEDLTQLLQQYPSYTKAYLARGIIYFSTGQYTLGRADMEQVLAEATEARLRQRASVEIFLAQFAQLLAPMLVVGAIGVSGLKIVEWLGLQFGRWGRWRTTAFAIAYIMWVSSLGLLFVYSSFIDGWVK